MEPSSGEHRSFKMFQTFRGLYFIFVLWLVQTFRVKRIRLGCFYAHIKCSQMENILSIAFYTANAGLNEALLGQLGWLDLNQLQFDVFVGIL